MLMTGKMQLAASPELLLRLKPAELQLSTCFSSIRHTQINLGFACILNYACQADLL